MSTLQAGIRPNFIDIPTTEQRRPFGSRFPPQSLIYFLYLPSLLTLTAAAGWIVPGDAMIFVGALVGAAVGLYALVDIVFRNAPLRLTSIYAMTLLLAYNLGSLISWLAVDRGSLSLAEAFARNPASLARALAACMVAAALLFVVGQLFENPIFGREFFIDFRQGAMPPALFSTLLLLTAYATGKVGFMGAVVDQSGHLSPIAALVMWWATPAFAYSVCATLNTTGLARWTLGALTLIQAAAIVPFGRRIFAFTLLVALIATRLGKYRLRIPAYKKLLLGTSFFLVVTITSVTFMYLRVAGLQQRGIMSIGTRLQVARDLLNSHNPLEILEMMGEVGAKRTFTIGFFSDLLQASQNSTPLLGKDILHNLQLTVPSAISGEKLGSYGEETMVNMQWGFAYKDEANSLLTCGAADFGFLGALLYPIVLVLMLRVILEWMQLAVPTKLAAFFALAYIFQNLQAESAPVAYFLQIRTTVMVAVMVYAQARMPVFRFRPSN